MMLLSFDKDDIMEGDKVRLILAGNIKRYRNHRNWSQADLAEKSGLSVVYLSDIERGNKWPYLDTLVKLAEAFELEIFELLKPEDAVSPGHASILSKYSDETAAIIEKSLEKMRKETLHSLLKLRNQYVCSAKRG
jgi:transcriptional regulator with XRE-family HTH domain